VTANQVLNDGVWNPWWYLIAVIAAAASLLTGYRLTAPSLVPGGQVPPAAKIPAALQSVTGSTTDGAILQLGDIKGRARISPRPLATDSLALEALPTGPTPSQHDLDSTQEALEVPPAGGQSVTNARVGGSIIQISSTGGDVDINP
jgi:hypothetical protein